MQSNQPYTGTSTDKIEAKKTYKCEALNKSV
jgi:hypothetical protein